MRSVSSSLFGRIATTGLVASLALSTALSTLGCKSLLKKKYSDAGASTTAKPTSQDLADEQLQEKLDEYIKCLNTLSSPIRQSRIRYLTYIKKEGPTGRETVAGLYRLPAGTAAACSTGVSKAQLMPPADTRLESSGREFSLAATDVDQVMNEMDPYYELKLFKDDKWAKGKAMHPRLMTAWDRFSHADKVLHDTLDGITKPLAQRVLGRIEREDGKKFRYGRKKTLITGRDLVDAAAPAGDDSDVDFNLYQAAYTDFEKSVDELIAYGSMHRADLNNQSLSPAWPLAEANYNAFVKEAEAFKHASKDFWSCLRDAPPRAKSPSGKIDVGKLGLCGAAPSWKTSDDVIKKYNDFIGTSNRQQFP